jgi:phosphatidylethanolamine/phosphatidyl-N-methylethanolamine N-methyltransferase
MKNNQESQWNKVTHIDWYETNYNIINESAKENSIAFKILHRSLERNHKSNRNLKIIEFGANNGEHLKFVKDDWKEKGSYIATDLKLPKSDVLKSLKDIGVTFQIANIEKNSYSENSFDRVIVTCVLHHLSNLELALHQVRKITKVGGNISIFLPNDPGLMYRGLRNITTVRRAKKLKLLDQLQVIHAREHRNHYLGILPLIKLVYNNDEMTIKGFPFRFPFYNINAYTLIEIKKQHDKK